MLGAITGALIGLPWSATIGASYAAALVMVFAVLGGAVGYKKRKSTVFFYLCLVSVIALASLLSSNFGSF